MPYADPEARRAYGRAYREGHREAVRRTASLNNWAVANVNPWPYPSLGALHDLRYAVATHCEYCGPIWGDFATLALTADISPRCMEHDHRPPFLFRAISCRYCNARRRFWDARILAVITELTPRYLRWWRRRNRISTG